MGVNYEDYCGENGGTPYCGYFDDNDVQRFDEIKRLAENCLYNEERGDQIVVLFDNDVIRARARAKDDIVFIGTKFAESSFVHEFSHSFGSLGDTYERDTVNQAFPEYPNCASDEQGYTCEDKWGDLIGTGEGDFQVGCFKNCGGSNWYRPTLRRDIMGAWVAQADFYDPVALRHMESLMERYE